MEYLVFPFGKYKGVKLEDLPSTYIVLALEKFELPDELLKELKLILFGRLKYFSEINNFLESIPINAIEFFLNEWKGDLKSCITKYEDNGKR